MTESIALNDRLNADTAAYAQKLMAAGFTVYVPVERRGVALVGWFHYSRTVDGQECYGIYSDGSNSHDGAHHNMPITPSRLNGSSASIGGNWGDAATFNLDNMPADTVDYALAVARPSNWCPVNAEPTAEAVQRANSGASVPQKFYKGATLKNATPSGIGTRYVAASL